MTLKKIRLPLVLVGIVAVFTLQSHKQEEGMFPLNYLNEKDLQAAGMKLSVKEIFNSGEVALTNALVKVGGCTGSFISDQGLIITNHHCVYGGVADLSNADHNYLENGFVAKNHEMELPIDMPCRITQSYEDVSARVLKGIDDKTAPDVRATTITANIKKIREEESAKTPDLSVEVSEMFVGKSYTLFRYTLITDVRLVFAPPVTIGQFGGDLDNWEWPRHNGDFGLVRAYVGKDGKPAPYSKDNVPYKPAKHLKINAKGSKENDFIFIMGYPGRTFRHESAPYMAFQEDFQLPTIQKWYAWCIQQMQNRGKNDVNKSLAFAGTIQGYANAEKNYRGKLQGLTRTNLVNRKFEDEKAMQLFANQIGQYEKVIPTVTELWNSKKALAEKRYHYSFLNGQSNPFVAASVINSAKLGIATAKDATEKQKIKDQLKSYLTNKFQIVDVDYEMDVLQELLQRIGKFRDLKPFLGKLTVQQWMLKARKDKLTDTAWVASMLGTKIDKLLKYKSPLTELQNYLSADMQTVEKEWNSLDNQLKAIMPQYLDLKEKYKSGQFIPDANSTLRLTYGYIKRYSPNDAEVHTPFTTLRGVWEKANTASDYRLPKNVSDNLRVENVPKFFTDPETGEVIVCFLYNLDTTGGNSGSPVLDAEGNIIGVNFDRSYTATINDYAWNDKYSRSIGVDIRYVLYVIKYVGKADNIIDELGLDI
ncbi:MAG: S46 family peptidase [Bacteroidia bacterium]|nr:S46 family peptidase [Bacteroidia bacterium]